jgi:hypothetical protein
MYERHNFVDSMELEVAAILDSCLRRWLQHPTLFFWASIFLFLGKKNSITMPKCL